MVEATFFIGAIIAGITQAIKTVVPEKVNGPVTVALALLVGIVIAIIDTEVGVKDISIAQGVMTAFGTIGVFTAVDRV